ncbi:MAG: MFS transporter [Microscillaceae bacterium]|nr:MFS transporter [Microscillaceae bacterium]
MKKQIYLIYAIVLVDMTAGSIIWPVLPQIVEDAPYPQLILALGTALFLGVQIFTAPLLGKLSDIHGRKPIFLLSAIGTFFANALLLFKTPLSFLANRTADGLTNGVYGVVKSSITDASTEDDLAKNMGLEGSVISIGFILGPLFSGGLILLLNLEGEAAIRPLILLSLLLSALNILLAFLFKETLTFKKQTSLSVKEVIKDELSLSKAIPSLKNLYHTNRIAFNVMLIQVFLTMSLGYYHYFITFIGLGELKMNAKEISQFFIYMGFINIVINYVFYTRFVDKINPMKFIPVVAVFGIITHIGYAFVGSSQMALYIVLTLDCLTVSLLPGLVDVLLSEQTEQDNRGEIFGYSQLFTSFANILTTSVFGLLSLISINFPFFWFAICLVPLIFVRRLLATGTNNYR